MATDAKWRRGFLRSIYLDTTPTLGATLILRITTCLKARYEQTSQGQYLSGTSANGASVSFQIPPGGEITPASLASECNRLYELHDTVKAALIAAGTANPTDAQIFTAMLADVSMRVIRRIRTDFSGMGEDFA